jgi:hypothetical protein
VICQLQQSRQFHERYVPFGTIPKHAKDRRYRDVADSQLIEQWIAAYKEMASSPFSFVCRKLVSDLQSELQLRGKEPPFEQIKEFTEQFISATVASIEDLRQNNPREYALINERLEHDIEVFKYQRDKSRS